MKSKRVISIITALVMLMSVIVAIPVSASNSYDEDSGIYTWKFENSQTGPADVEDGMLTIKLAGETDTITSSGVWFNGGSDIKTTVEQLARYIKVTPPSNGTIKATDANGRLKIAKEGANSSLGNSNNSSKTLSVSLEKDNVYYIYPTGQTKITAISFESDEVTAAESVLKDKDSVTFSFGSDEVQDAEKVTAVKYSKSAAYGFTDTDALTVNNTSISSSSDFTFNVLVPNGNYDITLGTTAETVSYEQIPNITYAKRIRTLDETKTFTAAVCDGTLDITIPANGELSSLTVAKQTAKTEREKPALFAVGDSTVNTTETNSSHPERGASKTWGVCVTDGDVTLPETISAFYNCGQAGANTITYYNDYEHENQGHLDDVLLNICPGDYVTVNLGINNKRDKTKTNTADDITDTSAYETIMRDYILQGILDRGGIPVVLTATPHGPIDSYESCYSGGVFSCERTGTDARTSTLLSIANKLNLTVIDVGKYGNGYFNSLKTNDIGDAESVLAYVQDMYIDHNHYKQALGEKIASYVLSSVSAIIERAADPYAAADEDGDGIYEWDFSDVTAATGSTAGTETVKYKGLEIELADNNANDTVSTSGVRWNGACGAAANTYRYIMLAPVKAGTLIVTGSDIKVAESINGTDLGTTVKCSAGTTYYIYATKQGSRVTNIQYINEGSKIAATTTFNNIYGSNMLLQREKPIKLDGTAENAEQVEIALTKNGDASYENKKTVTVSSGKWSVELDAVTLATPADYCSAEYTITARPVSADENTECKPTVLSNIKIGDLYLVAGQSNTKFYLNVYLGLDYNENELETNDNIRLMQEPTSSEAGDSKGEIVFARKTFQDKLAVAANWQPLTPDYAKTWQMPALTYSMATELYEQTGVPIGMLGTGYGGTEIALWRADNTKNTWYASRIHPLRNFAISGIFWYQGCNDKNNGNEYYEKNFRSLINEYRALFGNDKLPFYYVQLARNGNTPELNSAIAAGGNDDTTGMKDVRRAQFDVYEKTADKTNFGFVSTLDIYGQKEYTKTGKDNSFSARYNYHTGQKPVIAHRLAAWALKDIYGMDKYKDNSTIYTHGPLYKSHTTEGNKLIVEFDCNGSLSVMPSAQYTDHIGAKKITAGTVNPNIINEFEIAGSDGVYYPATAEISGNKVTLTASEVNAPASVRYAYSPYPESPNLTDESGLPAYAFTAEETVYPSWKFSFGSASKDGYTQVSKTQTYGSDSKDYGFLGLDEESANYKAVVDGYDQRNGSYTTLAEGTDYVKSTNKKLPVRFAMKVTPNTYYKVKVTMSAEGGNADATLTSERRHFVLTEESITDGGEITKEFTVGVHSVHWKNRDSGSAKEENYTDDMLNIGLIGENAALKSLEIQQIEKPKVLWIFGDSTVTDHVASMPYNIFGAEAGWGAAAAKYVNDDVAVVNLSEGGLSGSNTEYFNMGKEDIGSGDVVMMQMGHNETSASSYTANLENYRTAAAAADATFVLCSPIQRLENSESVNNTYTPAAKAYADAHDDVKYIDLNTLTGEFNTSLGTGAWYTHIAYWQSNGDGTYTAFNDATHLNDYGADNTCRMAMEKLALLTEGYVNSPMSAAVMPTESVMKNGGSDYVKPPYDNNELFPKSGETFEHAVELSDAVVENNILKSVKVTRNTQLSYITVFADIYDKDNAAAGTVSKRLESSDAGTSETVDFTDDNLTIPAGGKAVIYVYNGAEVDGSLDTTKAISNELEIEAAAVKYMHISFDDVYACLKDITDNKDTYTSVFDNSFLSDLKKLHDDYGAVFTLNCFNKQTTVSGYDISNLPEKYAEELKENSDWLKFAFHAQDEKTQYTTTAVSGRTNRTAAKIVTDYKTFTDAIMTATGGNKSSIDTVTRLGFFAGDEGCVDALRQAADFPLTGLLTADDTRVSYYFDTTLNNTVISDGYYYDTGKNLKLIRSQLRLESVSNTTSTLEALKSYKGDMIEIFTHEYEYLGKETVKNRVAAYAKWAHDNNISFGYAMDVIKTPADEPEKVTLTPTADSVEEIEVVKEGGSIKLVITPAAENGVTKVELYTAVYNPDGSLKEVSKQGYEKNGDTITVPLSMPQLSEDENCKLMLWDKENSPITKTVSSINDLLD